MTFDTPELSRHRVRLARHLSFVGFAGLGMALVMASVVGYFHHPREVERLLMLPYVLSLGGWGASFAVWFARFRRAAVVSIDAAGVSFSTAAPVPRASIASAYVLSRASTTTVEIVAHDGDVHAVVVPDFSAGGAVVAALGFGPGARRQTIDLAARKRRLLNLAIGFGAYQVASFSAVPLMLFTVFAAPSSRGAPLVYLWVAIVLPLLYRAFKRRTRAPVLEVGDDGLTIRRNRKSQFYPRASIHGAQLVAGSAQITLSTGTGNVVVGGSVLDRDRAQAVLDAMRTRWTQPQPQLPPIASFLRGGRDLAAWEADLRVRIATAGYRDASGVTVDDADTVLRSASAPAEARIGAALALKAAGQRVRIADAIAPVADTDLREALEAVAEETVDLRKLTKALGR